MYCFFLCSLHFDFAAVPWHHRSLAALNPFLVGVHFTCIWVKTYHHIRFRIIHCSLKLLFYSIYVLKFPMPWVSAHKAWIFSSFPSSNLGFGALEASGWPTQLGAPRLLASVLVEPVCPLLFWAIACFSINPLMKSCLLLRRMRKMGFLLPRSMKTFCMNSRCSAVTFFIFFLSFTASEFMSLLEGEWKRN